MKKLTNKQLWVLSYLREHREGVKIQEVADASPEVTKHFSNGDPYTTNSLHYSHAYVALQQLVKKGLVYRESLKDHFGDTLQMHVYFAEPEADPSDPLERAFAQPAAEPWR